MRLNRLVILLIGGLLFVQLSCSLNQFSLPPIVIYGDTRTNHEAHQKVVAAILKIKPAVVFHTGDLVENGYNPEEWAIFNAIASKLREVSEFYPALGNHEHNSPLYFDNFDLPNNERWYFVERNNTHFIVLDSNYGISKDSEQYRWLEADLKSISDKIRFVVVIFHHPPVSTGSHREDEMGLKETILPLFEEYGVDMVFCGHNHCYERSLYNGIYYVVTGGGGAPLYGQVRTNPYSQVFIKDYHFCQLSMIGRRLFVEVFDVDLDLIDRFNIRQKKVRRNR